MSIWCLGIYKKSLKGSTVGYLIGDTEAVTESKGTDGKVVKQIATKVVSTENLILGMKKGTKVENMELTAMGVKISSGSENAYPAYEPGTNKFLGIGDRGVKACQVYGVVKLPFVVVARDEKIGMHRCVMASGRIGDYSDAAIIKDVEQGGRVLSNATVVNDNGKKFIRLKKGEVEQVEKVKEATINKPASISAPVSQPVQRQSILMPQNTPKIQKPVVDKPVQQTIVPKINLSSFFEIKESSEFGTYISKVKIPDKKTLDNVIGENGRIRGPLEINGKLVKCIDVKAFASDIDRRTDEKYSCGEARSEEEYLGLVVNRFDFSQSGNKGFIVVDAEDTFSFRTIESTLCLYISNRDAFNTCGTVLTPHYIKGKQIPTAIGGAMCPSYAQLCILDNIRVLYKNSMSSLRGIDLRRSSVTFIPMEFAANCHINWILLNNRIERIHEKAFYGTSALETITLTAGIKEIAEKAFDRCIKLSSVKATAETEIKRISESAFAHCAYLKEFPFNCIKGTLSTKVFDSTSLTGTVVIPGTITKIGSACFRDTKISDITFEEGVEEIGGELLGVAVTKRGRRAYVANFRTVHMHIPKSLKTTGKLQELKGMAYYIHIGHGYTSEKAWIVEKSRLQDTKMEIIYEGEELSDDENSLATMLSIMGKEGLVNSLTSGRGGNDTPYSLGELLEM